MSRSIGWFTKGKGKKHRHIPITPKRSRGKNKSSRTPHRSPSRRFKTESKYKILVTNIVYNYKEKAGIKKDIAITYDKKGQKLADAKFVYGSPIHWIRINDKHLDELYEIDPEKARKFLEYGITHEISHLQQHEEKGHEWLLHAPKIYVELDAEKRTERLSGISEKQVDELTSYFEKKIKEKHGIKPKPPPSPDAPRLIMQGKKVARVIGWTYPDGKFIVARTTPTRHDLVPKTADKVDIVEFDREGTPIPKMQLIPRSDLPKYHLVP